MVLTSQEEVAAAVRELLPAVAERARLIDETGEIPADAIADLVATGALRLLQPKAHGGLEADPVHFYEAVRMVSGACGSTGLVAAVLGLGPWHVAHFDESAQDEVWSRNPEALICSSYAPVGRFTPVAGGYQVTGH